MDLIYTLNKLYMYSYSFIEYKYIWGVPSLSQKSIDIHIPSFSPVFLYLIFENIDFYSILNAKNIS